MGESVGHTVDSSVSLMTAKNRPARGSSFLCEMLSRVVSISVCHVCERELESRCQSNCKWFLMMTELQPVHVWQLIDLKPHPAVGRPGPVCPFVPMSLKRNIIY